MHIFCISGTKVFTDFKPRKFTLIMIDLGNNNILIRLELDDHILELDVSKTE